MKKVLLVDDEKPYLFALSDILHNDGYKVIPLESSDNIENILIKEEPDCVVIDATLEGVSGFEVSRNLKKNCDFSTIPVILLIPGNGDYKLFDAVTSGANDCIQKPVKRQELLEKVNHQIEIREQDTKAKTLNDMVYKVLDKSTFGLIILNFDCEILYHNKEVTGFLGSDIDLKGKSIFEVFKSEAEALKDMIDNKKHALKSDLYLFTLNEFASGFSLFVESNKENEKKSDVVLNDVVSDLVFSNTHSSLSGKFGNYLKITYGAKDFFVAVFSEGKCIFVNPDKDKSFLEVSKDASFLTNMFSDDNIFLGNISNLSHTDASYFKEKGFLSYIAIPVKREKAAILILSRQKDGFLNYPESLIYISRIYFYLYRKSLKAKDYASKPFGALVDTFKKTLSLSDVSYAFVLEGDILYSDAGVLSSYNTDILDFFKGELGERDYHLLVSSMKAPEDKLHLKFSLKRGFDLEVNVLNIEDNLNLCIFSPDKKSITAAFKSRLKTIDGDDFSKTLKELLHFFADILASDDTLFFTYQKEENAFKLKYSSGNIIKTEKAFSFTSELPEISAFRTAEIKDRNPVAVLDIFYDLGIKSAICIDVFYNSDVCSKLYIVSKKENFFCDFQSDIICAILPDIESVLLRLLKGKAELSFETDNNIILSLTRDAIFKLDNKGIILSVNNAIQQLLGHTPGELVNTHINEICAAENKWELLISKQGRYAFKNKKGGKKPFDTEYKKIDASGYYVVFHRI
jgi:PAS domain S-box-containing protein